MGKQTVIQVPFGRKGRKECFERARVNGVVDAKKLYGEMFNYMIDGLMSELKNRGYKKIGRARILFEEACDVQANLNIEKIIKMRKESNYTQTPAVAIFVLHHDIPKVE